MMAVRRRNNVERRVLTMLRGGNDAPLMVAGRPRRRRDRRSQPVPVDDYHFAELRRLALTAGLSILPMDAPFMNDDEVLLLGWLAQAQRVANPSIDLPHDRALLVAIVRCAGLLDAMSLRLAPLTIYAARNMAARHADRHPSQ